MAKYHFGKEELHYVGHVVGKEGIKVDTRIIKIVPKWHRPLELDNYDLSWGFAIIFANSLF